MEMDENLRKRMVEDQLIPRGIGDKRVLRVMEKVPRHLFAPDKPLEQIYGDYPLPIGKGQTISQPYIVALMTELSQCKETDRVLEIGTGSGYQAAVFSELVSHVYSLEIIESHRKRAAERLARGGYDNVTCITGNGYQGYPEEAPFDIIVTTAAPPDIPESLLNQLSPEGGRMVLPVGSFSQHLITIIKSGDKIERHTEIPVSFVPMVQGTAK